MPVMTRGRRTTRRKFATEIEVDLFAGGGGASVGIEAATGKPVAVAVNHNPAAIEMHRANHPDTDHFTEDVFHVDLEDAVGGRRVGLLHGSPDCRYFSQARGSMPIRSQDCKVRGLAWSVLKWARKLRPRVITLENVREFCFPVDTAVLTKRGLIPIGQIEVGDEVWTHNARWKPVTAIARRRSATVRVKGYGNSIVETTPNHKFYARAYAPKITVSGKYGRHRNRLLEPEWVRADRLADHDDTSAYTRQYSGWAWASPTEMPRYWMRLPMAVGVDCTQPAFFYMIGRWLGDGWIRRRKNRTDQDLVRICDERGAKADALEEQLAATGLKWTRQDHSESAEVFDLEVASSRVLVPWLTRHFGEFADGKTLPAWVFGASEAQRWALVEGYYDADGHEQADGSMSAASVSRCLATGMKLLLQSLGVSAWVSPIEGGERPYVGDPGRTMNCKTAYAVLWQRETEWEKCFRSELHLWGPVREVLPGREDVEVVDITVADDHSFIADGQVAHNCNWGPVVPQWKCRACEWKGTEGQIRLARPRLKRLRCVRCNSLRVNPVERVFVPDPFRKGVTFKKFVEQFHKLGYSVDWKDINAADFGAPTHRKRLFLVARRDGKPIVWPEPTHFSPKKIAAGTVPATAKRWRSAAECIDWSIPCPSIFDRKKPLVEKTQWRIAQGLKRYVLDNPSPFLVVCNHGRYEFRGGSIGEPLSTVTAARDAVGVCTPVLADMQHDNRGRSPGEPLGTVTGQDNRFNVVNPVLVGLGGPGYAGKPRDTAQPMGTVLRENRSAVVAPLLSRLGQYGGNGGYSNPADSPLTTVTTQAEHLCVAPTLVNLAHGVDARSNYPRDVDPEGPLGTVHAGGGSFALAAPLLATVGYGEREGQQARVNSVEDPAGTAVNTPKQALIAAWLVKHFGGRAGQWAHAGAPLPTILTRGIQTQVAAAHLVHLNHGDKQWSSPDDPMRSVVSNGNHAALVYSFLCKYHGTAIGQHATAPLFTLTGKDRFGLVCVVVDGQLYAIVDIGMRMLTPRELARAQGLPEDYVLTGSKTSQVARIGNSVPPAPLAAIVRANYKPKRYLVR